MKILKLLSLAMLLIFAACDTTKKEEASAETAPEETTVAAPEGTAAWNSAWNANDMEALKQMTADDAVMLLDGNVMNRQEIDAWFEANLSVVKELQTSPAKYNAGESITYEGGSYTHKVEGMGDQAFDGTYAVVWELSGDAWKIKLLDVSGKIPDPAAAEAK